MNFCNTCHLSSSFLAFHKTFSSSFDISFIGFENVVLYQTSKPFCNIKVNTVTYGLLTKREVEMAGWCPCLREVENVNCPP